MPQLRPVRLAAWSDRLAGRVAALLRSSWWPVLVLAGVALILETGPDVYIHGVSLRMILIVSVPVSLVSWALVDTVERWLGGAWIAGAGVVIGAIAASFATYWAVVHGLGVRRVDATYLGVLGGIAVVAGAYARWAFGRRHVLTQVVVLAAIASSAADLDLSLLTRPFRDARLYMEAARAFDSHAAVYLTAPLKAMPTDWASLPYLYPPFTLPFFGLLARLPHGLGAYVIVVLCAVSVIAGLRLLGVPWRLLPLLLIWPPIAIGVQVGNVACVGFLLLAAAWRVGMAAPLAGVFKAQSGVVSLWLIRERRWRALILGAVAIAALVVATLPLTGIAAYGEWLRALEYFQRTVQRFPSVMGLAIQRFQPASVAIGLAVAAVVLALLARGRDGLARFGVAAVVASPTVYIHGLALGLPAMLMLDAATAWGLMAVAPWGMGGWWALGIPLAALTLGLTRPRLAGAPFAVTDAGQGERGAPQVPHRPAGSALFPGHVTSPPFDADVHPLGALHEPWPDPVVDRRAVPRLVPGGERREPDIG